MTAQMHHIGAGMFTHPGLPGSVWHPFRSREHPTRLGTLPIRARLHAAPAARRGVGTRSLPTYPQVPHTTRRTPG